MQEKILQVYDHQGTEAVIALIREMPEAERMAGFDETARHAYWQKKDLPGAVALLQAGIAEGGRLATAAPSPEGGQAIRNVVKMLCYNLASFTWPGWDEPGIVIGDEQVKAGLEAAQANLVLARELHKPPIALSRAYWMLAAQQIAQHAYPKAIENFAQAGKYAEEAGEAAEKLLASGFALAVCLLQDPQDRQAEHGLEEITAALRKEKDGEFFVKQIENALRVFGR